MNRTVAVAGATYQLAPLCEVLGAVGNRAGDAVRAFAVGKVKPLCDPATWRKFFRELDAEIGAGAYGFGGPKWREFVGTEAGTVLLTHALLEPNHRGITAADVLQLLDGADGPALLGAVADQVERYERQLSPR
jgi:hypothetical protein